MNNLSDMSGEATLRPTGGPAPDAEVFPDVLAAISGSDQARTHFTFINIGSSPAFSITVDTVRHDEQTMDFEPIETLLPGGSFSCLPVVNPVFANDPHWTFDFWTCSGEEFSVPFVVRYKDMKARPVVVRNSLQWNGRRASLIRDHGPEPDS